MKESWTSAVIAAQSCQGASSSVAVFGKLSPVFPAGRPRGDGPGRWRHGGDDVRATVWGERVQERRLPIIKTGEFCGPMRLSLPAQRPGSAT